MDERRPEDPAAGPPRAAATAGLSPLQRAYSAYVRHALGCVFCRDVDAGPCAAAELLWRAYRGLVDEAFVDLNGGQ